MKKFLLIRWVAVTVLLFGLNNFAQNTYQKPPKEIEDVLNAPSIPQTSVSPAKDKILTARTAALSADFGTRTADVKACGFADQSEYERTASSILCG